MDLAEARKATRNGAVAAAFAGTMTLLVTALAVHGVAGDALSVWNDPLNYIDGVIVLVLAFGIWRHSRAAAILMLLFFVIARIIMAIETGRAAGLFVTVLLVYFFVKAVQGSFVYHRLRKAEDPDYRPAARWLYWTGIPAGVVLVLLAGFGLYVEYSQAPPVEITKGSDLDAATIATLRESGVLFEDERIDLFYSYGIVDPLTGGTVLSDRAVITWYSDPEQGLLIYELTFAEIEEVRLLSQGDFLNDSIYRVSGAGEDQWIEFPLSATDDGDARFVKALQEKVLAARAADSVL